MIPEGVLGLDVSTSCVGIVLLEPMKGSLPKILHYGHVDFKKCKTMWDKADRLKQNFDYWANVWKSDSARRCDIKHVYIEDAAKRFQSGMSSANVIATLLRFNGLASYFARESFGLDPEYLAVGTARRLCGLKMQKKVNSGGLNQKQQTFNAIMGSDLSHITWPTKVRSANIVDYAYDIVDAYVICKGACVLNT